MQINSIILFKANPVNLILCLALMLYNRVGAALYTGRYWSMVNSVSPSGSQAYAYQQALSSPLQEPRGGENRIEARKAPAADSHKAGGRESGSQGDQAASANGNRGNVVDLTV